MVLREKLGIVKERRVKIGNLVNGRGRRKVTQERKEAKTELEKNFLTNRNKRLCLNVSSHLRMKVMMIG